MEYCWTETGKKVHAVAAASRTLCGRKPHATKRGEIVPADACKLCRRAGATFEAETPADQIKAAYGRLAQRPRDWVYLDELRPLLAEQSKTAVDRALKEMYRARECSLTLEEDQGSLTDAQRAAAVRVGIDDLHLIAIG